MKTKSNSVKKIRFRNITYRKAIEPLALEWYNKIHPEKHYTYASFAIVSSYLKEHYDLEKTSTTVRRIKGKHIHAEPSKHDVVFRVRVDFFKYTDERKLMMFMLKFSPTVIHTSMYHKTQGFEV